MLLLLALNGHSLAAPVKYGSCAGEFSEDKVKHAMKLEIFEENGLFDLRVQEFVGSVIKNDFRVSLENRYVLSRVQFYSREPYLVQLLFSSTTFGSKGLLYVEDLNDDSAINVKCNYVKTPRLITSSSKVL